MVGVKAVGDVKDVCFALKNEAERCKGMTVLECIRFRELEEVVAKQFGMPVAKYRMEVSKR